MTDNQDTITICMGSSCFSRGNKLVLRLLQEYLKEHGLEEVVVLKGTHCMGICDKGPVLMINEDKITEIDPAKLSDLLDSKLAH